MFALEFQIVYRQAKLNEIINNRHVNFLSRFWQLWQNVHLVDNEQDPGDDKLFKFRAVMDSVRNQFKAAFDMGPKYSVDEHMV